MSNLTLLPEVMIGDSSGTPIKMEQYMIDCLTSCKLTKLSGLG